METITLKGGNVCYTDNIRTIYEVISGEVLAYIVPIKDGKAGRRLFLGSFLAQEKIPGFDHSSELYGSWKIVLAAVDCAEIAVRPGEMYDALLYAFAEYTHLPMMKIRQDASTGGLSDDAVSQFEEAIIEKYNRDEVKQDGYIYATIREKEYTKEHTLRTILNSFSKNGVYKGGKLKETGNNLYDAAALLCMAEGIEISPLEKVEDSSGRKFDINDIARVSHFTIREVILEENWYRRDCGAYLAFIDDENHTKKHPVALIPKGPYRYVMYDPKAGTYTKVTDKTAQTISPSVYMFYRPFPQKVISAKDLVSFGLQKVYSADIVRIVFMALLGVFIGMLIPYINEQAYDRFIPMGNASGFVQLGGLLIACALGGISFAIVKNLSVFRSMNTMEYAIQSAVFDRLFNLPESFYRDYDAATLGLDSMEITNIFTTLSQGMVAAALSLLFSLLYLVQMFIYSKDMAVVAIVLMAVVVAFTVFIGIHNKKLASRIPTRPADAQAVMFQFIKGITKLRMAGAEDRALSRYMDKLVDGHRCTETQDSMDNVINTMLVGVEMVFTIVFYFMMIRKNIGLSIGAFTAFTAAFGAFSVAAFTLIQTYLQVNQIRMSYDNVKPILETLPENSDDLRMPGDLSGEIEISNVTFGYDSEQEPVINDLSLRIAPGEYLGIVGTSGCGKTTLMKILLGFEKPQIGRVYYDNQDIDGLDKRELRKKLGVVLQGGGLIAGSIYENITITTPGVKMDRVEETVRSVGLEEDINRMPMGLHTVVSDEAETISGGQKQRILIARAMVGKPRVLFLDEATSALDNTTQAQVVATLEQLDATKVVVAHRLSTVANCDRIIVLDKGSIKEEGTYKQLMDKKGLFYELAIRQIS